LCGTLILELPPFIYINRRENQLLLWQLNMSHFHKYLLQI